MPNVPNDAPADRDRLAALERQVAELTARLQPAPPAPPATPAYGRRDLLRRSGAVLATAAGAAVLSGRPAAAAPGDPVLAGQANDAVGATTSLTGGTATGPALSVANPAVRAEPGVGTYGAPALRLPAGPGVDLGLDVRDSAAGDLASGGDHLWYGHVREGESTVVGSVYTSAFANHLEFVTPRRVLDTRRPIAGTEAGAPNDGRSRVVAGRFDVAGRLGGGTSLVLDLSGLLVGEQAGVLGTLTVIGPPSSGFLAAYPTPEGSLDTTGAGRPAVSTVNFTRGASAVGGFTVLGFRAGNRLSIYTTTTAHVTFDVVAFSVFDPFSTVSGSAARTASGWRGRSAR